jgi:ferric-dicitrate binding protein FerR (iron transport regulator)
MAQWHCTVSGQQYGPVELEAVRQWLAEGRLKSSDMVWTEGMAAWQPAGSVPELGAAPGPFAPGAPQPPPIAGDIYTEARRWTKPHRANTVLVFGILGLVVCAFLGIAAWVMGNNDLKEMDAGIMDPSGRDSTNTGRILGMVSTILGIAGVGFGLLWFIAFAGSAFR